MLLPSVAIYGVFLRVRQGGFASWLGQNSKTQFELNHIQLLFNRSVSLFLYVSHLLLLTVLRSTKLSNIGSTLAGDRKRTKEINSDSVQNQSGHM